MKKTSILMLALGLAVSAGAYAAPQSHDDHAAPQASAQKSAQKDAQKDAKPAAKSHAKKSSPSHKKGERLASGNRGESVDYRAHKLKAPPKGHEWRKVGNDYVLIAVATGLITSVIAAGN